MCLLLIEWVKVVTFHFLVHVSLRLNLKMSETVEFHELGDLGGLSGEVSGEIRVPVDDSELDDEGSTLDEPVVTTLVSPKWEMNPFKLQLTWHVFAFKRVEL